MENYTIVQKNKNERNEYGGEKVFENEFEVALTIMAMTNEVPFAILRISTLLLSTEISSLGESLPSSTDVSL